MLCVVPKQFDQFIQPLCTDAISARPKVNAIEGPKSLQTC